MHANLKGIFQYEYAGTEENLLLIALSSHSRFVRLQCTALRVLNAEDYVRKDGTADDVKAPPPPAEMFSLSTIPWACRRLAFSLRRPASMSFNWHTIEETGNRLLFSLTMGIASLVMLVGLWIISVPWISWRIVRWVFPPVRLKLRRRPTRYVHCD